MSEQEEVYEDSTDVIGNKINEIFKPIPEECKDLVEENEDKKTFVSRLSKILTILLTTKCNSLAKLKKIIKASAEIAMKLWPEQNLWPERFYSRDKQPQRIGCHLSLLPKGYKERSNLHKWIRN